LHSTSGPAATYSPQEVLVEVNTIA